MIKILLWFFYSLIGASRLSGLNTPPYSFSREIKVKTPKKIIQAHLIV